MEPAGGATSISVVVCTYKRADYLDRVLASLVDQSFPKADYEVLVVDNGCDDDVRAVTLKYSAQAQMSYVREPKVGLVWARNTGVRCAGGAHVVFIDDDALADPAWLQSIARAFAAGGPNLIAVGGPIELIWESARPRWLADGLLASLGHLDYGTVPRYLGNGEWIYGGNMAFRASGLEEIGGFPLGLGREGNKGHLLSNEEVFVQHKLAARGYSRFYDPAVLARHHVSPERLTPGWFISRYYWQGVSGAVMAKLLDDPSLIECLRKAGSSARALIRSPGELKALMGSILTRDSATNLTMRCRALGRAGCVRGWLTPRASHAGDRRT